MHIMRVSPRSPRLAPARPHIALGKQRHEGISAAEVRGKGCPWPMHSSHQRHHLLQQPARGAVARQCQENCSIRAFVKVALQERLPRDSWCRHGLVAQNDGEPGTPGVSRMRVDGHTGCSESPDTIPVRQGGFARSTGYTVATGPALSNADPQLLAKRHPRRSSPQLATRRPSQSSGACLFSRQNE